MITGRWVENSILSRYGEHVDERRRKGSLPFELLAVAGIVKTTERRLGHIDVTVSRPVFLSAARTGDLMRCNDLSMQSLESGGTVSNDLRESWLRARRYCSTSPL